MIYWKSKSSGKGGKGNRLKNKLSKKPSIKRWFLIVTNSNPLLYRRGGFRHLINRKATLNLRAAFENAIQGNGLGP